MLKRKHTVFTALLLAGLAMSRPLFAQDADDPELIFKKTTVWRMLSPDAKLATYALDDPLVEGIACHFTVPEIGGWSGWAGFVTPPAGYKLRETASKLDR